MKSETRYTKGQLKKQKLCENLSIIQVLIEVIIFFNAKTNNSNFVLGFTFYLRQTLLTNVRHYNAVLNWS